MFRQHFIDDMFKQNMYEIQLEMRRKERKELGNIPDVDIEMLEQRINNCYVVPVPNKHVKCLDQGLNDSKKHNEKKLKKRLEQAQFHQLHRRVLKLRRKNDVTIPRGPDLVKSAEITRLKKELFEKTQISKELERRTISIRTQLNYTDAQHWGLHNHIHALQNSNETEDKVLLTKLKLYVELLRESMGIIEVIDGLEQELHRATVDATIRRQLQRPQFQSMHLQQLHYDLTIQLQKCAHLKRQTENLRKQVGYDEPDSHFGLSNHIQELKNSKQPKDQVFVKKLQLYSDLLSELLTLSGEAADMRQDVQWAETVQTRPDIKRLIRKILRVDYEIEKLGQLTEHAPEQFQESYDNLLVQQQQNRSKLKDMI